MDRAIFGAAQLIKKIANVDDRLPPQREAKAGEVLGDVNVYVGIVNTHAAGERVNGEDHSRRRETHDSGNSSPCLLSEIQIQLCRSYLKKPAAEKMIR